MEFFYVLDLQFHKIFTSDNYNLLERGCMNTKPSAWKEYCESIFFSKRLVCKCVILSYTALMLLSCDVRKILICDIVCTKGNVWYVHPDSTLNSIQMALDLCTDYDTVRVAQGTYYENLVWPNTQGIHLVSELGPNLTVIDGDSMGRVITIRVKIDSLTIIEGFTIQNGYASDSGGGIYCGVSSSPKIMSNIIINNKVWADTPGMMGGGGICCDSGCSAIIIGNTFTGNHAPCGGGICCCNSSSVIEDNTITGNSAGGMHGAVGGGIYCDLGFPIITGNIITENHAASLGMQFGAGIACNSSSAFIIDNVITGNGITTGTGGGIAVMDLSGHASLTITDNTITDNVAGQGGGINCGDQNAILKHNTICRNTSYYQQGGGISCYGPDSLKIDSCTISNNNGDGVYNSGKPIVINYCNITGNTGYGVRNTSSAIISNAILNWWGDPSGPGGVGPGTGDEVSTYVDFIPWLTQPVDGIE